MLGNTSVAEQLLVPQDGLISMEFTLKYVITESKNVLELHFVKLLAMDTQNEILTVLGTAWTRQFHHSLQAETGQCICSDRMNFQFYTKCVAGGYQSLKGLLTLHTLNS
jgi:hypothetical protein